LLSSVVPRADFKVDQFDALIDQKGFNTLWMQSMFCSCYDLSTGQPEYTCKVCKGKGYVYLDPVKTKVVVSSISGNKVQETVGLQDIGHALLTSKSNEFIGFRDKFIFPEFTCKFSEVLIKGEDFLKYEAKKILFLQYKGLFLKNGIDFKISSEDYQTILWSSDVINDEEQYSVLYLTSPVYLVTGIAHELRATYHLTEGNLEKFVELPKQYSIKREDIL